MAKQTINLVPEILDMSLYAGDGTNFRLVVTDGAGVPIPLTGTMLAQIRLSRNEADLPIVQFDIDLTEFENGIVGLSLTGAQTQQLIIDDKKFSGVWDLEWTPIDEEPRTIVQGSVECAQDVSH